MTEHRVRVRARARAGACVRARVGARVRVRPGAERAAGHRGVPAAGLIRTGILIYGCRPPLP